MSTYAIKDEATGSAVNVTGTQMATNTAESPNVQGSSLQNATLPFSATKFVAFRFNSGAGATNEFWYTASAYLSAPLGDNGTDAGNFVSYDIWSDSAGLPGSHLKGFTPSLGFSYRGVPNLLYAPALGSGTAQVECSMSSPWSPANSTYYWLVISITNYYGSAATGTYDVSYDNSTGSGLVATSPNGGSTWASAGTGTGNFQVGPGTGNTGSNAYGSVVGTSVTGSGVYGTSTTGVGVIGQATLTGQPALFPMNPGNGPVEILGPSSAGQLPGGVSGQGDMLLVTGAGAGRFWVDEQGNINSAGRSSGITTVTAAYAVQASSDHTVLVNAASKTITLPNVILAGSGSTWSVVPLPVGREFAIKNTNLGSSTTIACAGTAKIDNASTYALASALNGVNVKWDGANYWIIGKV